MIESVKRSATRRFIEGGRCGFSGMNGALACRCLAECDAARGAYPMLIDTATPRSWVARHEGDAAILSWHPIEFVKDARPAP